MQVIGLCRFSYPAEGGFQVGHETIEDRRRYLYAPERIEDRLRSFEAITLAGLRAQTDPDFTFVILVDEALPEPLAERLLALIQNMPQAVVVPWAPGPHRKVCQQVLNMARTDPAASCIQFRMDDDDTVAVDFVERLRADVKLVQPLCDANRLVTLDYNRGFVVQADARGLAAEECTLPYYPMGMAMVIAGGVRQSIMNFGHSKVAQFMPTVTFTDSPMYIRGHNAFNDSRQKAHVQPVRLPRADAATLAVLQNRFGVTEPEVRRIYGA
ncbi:putative rhamnosyl transferase [Tropicibacter oceani]|uniref:Rhamnosyl transferase n=1 Tax=Tropicibacter oceani TaxID=3058420 RepID=A0ABY8QKQ3_9RHOB|nr:putative rhamnosyl transferase [Tropicibacter oceani]WGW05209.1 putative rhamnosyl transferase [Tropicibacter oceani]